MSDMTGTSGSSGPAGSLAEQQAALVAALVLGAEDPPGVDGGRLAATRRQLLDKRARVVAGVWPGLAAAFGDGWRAEFGAWARDRAPAGARLDGYEFAAELARGPRQGVPPAATGEIAAVLLDWRPAGSGLRRRRGVRTARVHGRLRVAWAARAAVTTG